MKKQVGFIGLGIMGQGMARNLLKANFPLTVWNRTISKADALVAAGAAGLASTGAGVSGLVSQSAAAIPGERSGSGAVCGMGGDPAGAGSGFRLPGDTVSEDGSGTAQSRGPVAEVGTGGSIAGGAVCGGVTRRAVGALESGGGHEFLPHSP